MGVRNSAGGTISAAQFLGWIDPIRQTIRGACVLFILGVGVAVASGCRAPTPEQVQQRSAEAEKLRLEVQRKFVATLPTGAENVRDEGNSNVSFTLTRDGQTHRYWAYYQQAGATTFRATITRMD